MTDGWTPTRGGEATLYRAGKPVAMILCRGAWFWTTPARVHSKIGFEAVGGIGTEELAKSLAEVAAAAEAESIENRPLPAG